VLSEFVTQLPSEQPIRIKTHPTHKEIDHGMRSYNRRFGSNENWVIGFVIGPQLGWWRARYGAGRSRLWRRNVVGVQVVRHEKCQAGHSLLTRLMAFGHASVKQTHGMHQFPMSHSRRAFYHCVSQSAVTELTSTSFSRLISLSRERERLSRCSELCLALE
jgi:hypothetical protein